MKNKGFISTTSSFLCFALLISSKFIDVASKRIFEENGIVELDETAENVCVEQKVQNQIINVTFIQTQVNQIFRKSVLCIFLEFRGQVV